MFKMTQKGLRWGLFISFILHLGLVFWIKTKQFPKVVLNPSNSNVLRIGLVGKKATKQKVSKPLAKAKPVKQPERRKPKPIPRPAISKKVPKPVDAVQTAPKAASSSTAESLIKTAVEPVYPRVARRRGQQGKVKVRIFLSKAGKVLDVDLLVSSGFKLLDASALKAAKSWEFKSQKQSSQWVSSLDRNFVFKIR